MRTYTAEDTSRNKRFHDFHSDATDGNRPPKDNRNENHAYQDTDTETRISSAMYPHLAREKNKIHHCMYAIKKYAFNRYMLMSPFNPFNKHMHQEQYDHAIFPTRMSSKRKNAASTKHIDEYRGQTDIPHVQYQEEQVCKKKNAAKAVSDIFHKKNY